jgi:riboflavin biosynthesis pyrimidine reductase
LIRKIVRLYPLPAREVAGALYEDLEMPSPWRRDASRPYVVINMVSSVDGKSTMGGKASRIGSVSDRQTMRTLRSKADAVMIGANTLRAEKLSLGLDEPARDPQPLAVIVTNTGNVPLESNLIIGEGQEVVVVAPGSLDNRFGRRARIQIGRAHV